MEVRVQPLCKHCQRPSKGQAEFCCAGCAAAYSFINELGMGDFYSKLGAQSLKPAAPWFEDFWDRLDVTSFVHPLGKGLSRVDLQLDGITCSACGWLVERAPMMAPALKRATLDLGRSRVAVVYDSSTPLKEVAAFFNKLGYGVRPPTNAAETQSEIRQMRSWMMRVAVAFASALGTMHVALTLYAGMLEGIAPKIAGQIGLVSLALSLPAVGYSALPFYRNALIALRMRRLNMDVLVTISVAAGFLVSTFNALAGRNEMYFDAVTMLITLLLGGRMFVFFSERAIVDRSTRSIWDPIGRFSMLKAGDEIVIKSGEIFPCDGSVIEGESSMNASWLTGEQAPVPLQNGSAVFAGAVNIGDQIRVRAEKTGENTKAGGIVKKLISLKKSRFVVLSEKVQNALIAAAAALAVIYVIYGIFKGFNPWPTMIALLMVTCPCALGLAAPSVITSALNQALKIGLLVKDGDVFERLCEIDTLVFDKTGTLTSPDLQVTKVTWNEFAMAKLNLNLADLENFLSAMVRRSVHPTLGALAQWFSASSLGDVPCREIPGRGLESTYNGFDVRLGARSWSCEKSQSNNLTALRKPRTETELVLTLNGHLIGEFELKTTLRPEGAAVLKELSEHYDIVILSGDTPAAVEEAARRLGIPREKIYASQTPEKKLQVVEELAAVKKVMMVGDGINDLLALRKAHVGIAVSGGSGASLEHSDAYLIEPNLWGIVQLLEAARRVQKAILFNFAWVAVYNLAGAALVIAGYLGPIICAILMPLSSITVAATAWSRNYFRGEPPGPMEGRGN